MNDIRRGEIYYADLSPVVGSEQGGVRPIVVLQNNVGNRFSPTVIVAAITSQIGKAKIPTHIELPSSKYYLPKDSVVLLEQIRTIDKTRLKQRVSELDMGKMEEINRAILISLGFVYGGAKRAFFCCQKNAGLARGQAPGARPMRAWAPRLAHP